jgi:YggT family protein
MMSQTFAVIASFLADIIGVYSFLVIIRIFLSGPFFGQNQTGTGFIAFLGKIVDPFLGFFKKLFYKGGRLDFSPMWALVCLNILKSILKLFYLTGKLTVGSVITIFFNTVWTSVFSFLNIVLIIILIYRLSIERRIDPKSMQRKELFDNLLNGLVFKVYNLFYKGKGVTDLRLLQTTLAIFIVIEIVGSVLNRVLIGIFL